MSDTPFTDSRTYGFTDEDGIHCEAVHADFARKLERERDEAREAAEKAKAYKRVLKETNAQLKRERDRALKLLAEMKQAIIWAKAEAKERLHRLDQAACERRTWLEAEHKMKLERDEARKALTLIADDCDAWLVGESDEPSMEFIKLVAKYAREASK